MIELSGVDMFDPKCVISPFYAGNHTFDRPPVDAWCITTNGTRKRNGCAVLGAGVAKKAVSIWPELPLQLGVMIKLNGNRLHEFSVPVSMGEAVRGKWLAKLIAFPVKHEWFEQADLSLIRQSAQQLVDLTNSRNWSHVVLPFPGVGNGKLPKDDVRPVISAILDYRFSIVSL